MTEDYAALQRELDRLEASDPEVAKAKDELDQTIFEITHLPPKRRFRKDLGGRSE